MTSKYGHRYVKTMYDIDSNVISTETVERELPVTDYHIHRRTMHELSESLFENGWPEGVVAVDVKELNVGDASRMWKDDEAMEEMQRREFAKYESEDDLD